MKTRFILGLVVVVLFAGLVFARTASRTYDANEAASIRLPVQYLCSLQLVSPNASRVIPLALNQPYYSSERLNIDGLDVVRIDDYSTGANVGTFNVVINYYSEIFLQRPENHGGATINTNYRSTVKMGAVTLNLNENYVISSNQYHYVDFTVSPKNVLATANITFNLTIRPSIGSLGNSVFMDTVTLSAGVAKALDYSRHRAFKISNYTSAVVYLGDANVSATNYGSIIDSAYGRGQSFDDIGATVYAFSATATTLNVLMVK